MRGFRTSTCTNCVRGARCKMANRKVANTSRNGHARSTVRREHSKTQMCRRQRRDANWTNTGYNFTKQMRWSKWTWTHKAEALRFECFAEMRESWFKMKGDHRKTQASTSFDFQKHIVKLATTFEKDKRFCGRFWQAAG